MTDYRTQPINQKNADFVEQVADRIEEMQLEGRSLWQDAKRRFFRNKAAVASLIILAFIIVFITVAPWFFPFTYEDTDWNMMSAAPRSLDATRISTWNAASAVVITIFLNEVSFFRLAATKNTKMIFTSSDG